MTGSELAGLFLHPRQNLIDVIRTVKPSILARQRNLPKYADGENQQQRRRGYS
jgi:hypothetical protein